MSTHEQYMRPSRKTRKANSAAESAATTTTSIATTLEAAAHREVSTG